ncbi:MAG: NUDIX hydrolase [Ignavibacteriae bacterium]|nr:NUDIX hydrolase [Ignavibacteria bacterium]MBI3365198.1 NUDIX hydrolase [Ignavibacteriota bacterium]
MQLKLLRRNKLYQGRVFNVIVDDVEYPSGNRSVREVAEHSGGSVILAVYPDNRIILVYQHRYPFDKFMWELPAGKLNIGENPIDCAKRELAEETGCAASTWRKLTAISTTPGFCSEVLHIYLATDLTQTPDGRKLEEGELTMTMKLLPLSDAIAMIERGEIVDGKTICGIFLGERILRKEGTLSGSV